MKLITIQLIAKEERGMTAGEIATFMLDVTSRDAPWKKDYWIKVQTTDAGMIRSLETTLALNDD